MAPVLDMGDYWEDLYGMQTVEVDCLMPTGIIIVLSVEQDATIVEIKAKLWKEAQKYSLYAALKDKNSYVFMCVLQNAEKVELMDESKQLMDIKIFRYSCAAMLKVVEKKGNEEEKMKHEKIGHLLDKRLNEFDNLKSPEVSDFRIKMKKVCENIAKERDCQDWLHRAHSLYPPDIDTGTHRAPIDTFHADIYTESLANVSGAASSDSRTTVEAHGDMRPCDLVQHVLNLHRRKFGRSSEHHQPQNYALKICGRQEFLLGDYRLQQFKYIRRMFKKQLKPSLILVDHETVLAGAPPTIPPKRQTMRPQQQNSVPPHRFRSQSLWDFHDVCFSLTIRSTTNVQHEDFSKFQLKACLYHGPEPITDVISSEEVICMKNLLTWETQFQFDITLVNIPRMARLCFVLQVAVDKRNKKERPGTKPNAKRRNPEMTPVAWVNIPLFDYQGVLRSGLHTLYMWNIMDGNELSEEELNPIGPVEDNPFVQEALCLNIDFLHYNPDGVVTYPDFKEVLSVANENVKENEIKLLKGLNEAQQHHLTELQKIIEKDPLAPLHEQEKDLVWRLRFECHYHYPHSLPKLLSCVQWNNHKDVAMMQSLLQVWKPIPPEHALELLDFAYADRAVRKFAVDCIREFTDAELLRYLLQLVQVVKYESYLDCELVEFLLERALNNQKVGHYMFWLLRSEIHIPSFGVRFGLILEAYCWGNITHLQGLLHQVEALDKFNKIAKALKKEKNHLKAKEQLGSLLVRHQAPCFDNLISTLDPGHLLNSLVFDKCKVMDSKMRPLWMVFRNMDPHGEKVTVMYKDGDDLRQDMLILQILRIMDMLWQEEGLDLNIITYGCLPTGNSEGLIEVVTESDTISNIQKKHTNMILKSAFNKKCLFEWLKKSNDTDEKMEKAMELFSQSCAGYCVATYVLGVADRHSDNILLKENGQLFHIDFGHILGNYKVKFHVKRERVPFVLTTDYVYVISRGPKGSKAGTEFKKFEATCLKAFMVLRRHSNLILTLLMMMMNTGIPELTRLEDIEYVKNSLVPHLGEEAAKNHFKQQFEAALKNSWTASVNNTFHNMTRDNK